MPNFIGLERLFTGPFSGHLLNIAGRLLYSDMLRPVLLRLTRNRIQAILNDENAPLNQRKIILQRRLMFLAITRAVERAVSQRAMSRRVAYKVTGLWARALFAPTDQRPAVKRFREQYHHDPPWFITVSPGQACNLKCEGCYADSGSSDAKLEWSVLERIISEAKALWDIRLVVFSGGEPLAYRSEGKDVLDVVERHPDLLFLMFTNGTLLDERTAERLGSLGNLTPAFSVEGMRFRTDKRRGDGVFDAVVDAMAWVRRAGVPLGISVTVNRTNLEEILSDDFLDFFFDEQDAFYGFCFQYLPIGRRPSFEDMPTPAERVAFWRKAWKIVKERQIFLVDFWNHGPLVKGCISAGRGGGYLYIDWSGKVMPCVFVPYSVGNVHDVYQRGGTLNDLWETPFLEAIRKWQDTYGYAQQEPTKDADWLCACPFRDHHSLFRKWVDLYQPEPEDEAAADALADAEYSQRLCEYEVELSKLFGEIWDREYLYNR